MAVMEGNASAQSVAASASAPDVHADAVSIVGGHYFPTDDGEEDMTYEVVVRNASSAPVEFAAPVLDGRELKAVAPAVASALKEFSFDFGGGKLGGRGGVVFKGAREGHDMRFDVPVMGLKTVKVMKSVGVTALAFQAGRQIVLEKEAVVDYANRHGIALIGVKTDLPPAPTRP